ncbi:twitching motility protein PilH [hydrothermal vent metagenome]|uniref:Twitching motility protein PilH n=1 Tax=hydrothermal vent metagenome TaxID=652676 RepID=A0A3B1AKK8_9ZZZZ
MKEKHALIVDDSRSARLVLQRMLKKYGVNAHTVASAEDALDYLLRHRPDVIFMDHLMPGMDGFEAVKHIKKNLDTATIPIIMFTSQSGELYLSQARALGAVDILPKATASTELYESLRRLGLLKKAVETVDVPESTATKEKNADRSIRALTSDFLRPNKKSETDEKVIGELQSLRRYLSDQTETQHQNIQASLRLYSGKLYKSFAEKLEEKTQLLQTLQVKPEKRSDFPLLLLLLLLFISLFWNYSLQNKIIDIDIAANSAVNEDTVKSMLNELSVQQRSRVDTDIPESSHNWNLAEWAVNQNLIFPYNELALGRQRLIQIRQLLKIAEAAGFKGKIVLQTHIGEFCLRGNVEEGYQLAAADLPLNRCDEIINPAQSSDLVSMQQSVEFANFLAMATTDYRSIKLEVINLPREQSLYEYPSTTADVTAGQWNRIAQMNNRIVAKLVAE